MQKNFLKITSEDEKISGKESYSWTGKENAATEDIPQ